MKSINLWHMAMTAVWCLACLFVGLPWPFQFWVPAWYCGREVAQAEYRYIEAHGGKRVASPWYCGFLPEAWTLKGMLDWLLPTAVALAACVVQAVLR